MSWLDDILDVGKSVVGWFTGDSATAGLARTALTSYSLNQVTKSINRENAVSKTANQPPDKGVRLQVNPNPNAKIPVVYGRAALGGIVTDAFLTGDNLSMYYCLTICEQTGNLNLGAGSASQISFKDIYWNNQRLIFQQSGETAGYQVISSVDESGNINNDVANLIQIFCYSGGSSVPVFPQGYTNATTYLAPNIMPNWTANHLMSDLVFVIVRVNYNREKNVTGLGDMTFVIENTMSQAGDCLYDYMTNTRYGAGIDPSGIYAS